jgi:hypothetical protein
LAGADDIHQLTLEPILNGFEFLIYGKLKLPVDLTRKLATEELFVSGKAGGSGRIAVLVVKNQVVIIVCVCVSKSYI